MGVVHFPAYRMLWQKKTEYPPLNSIFTRKRFEQIKSNFHISDCEATPSGDRLFRVRPLYEHVRANCQELPTCEYFSIDEQVIPTKSKRNKLRQYNSKKPKSWGIKSLALSNSRNGLVHNFYIYEGIYCTYEFHTHSEWLIHFNNKNINYLKKSLFSLVEMIMHVCV